MKYNPFLYFSFLHGIILAYYYFAFHTHIHTSRIKYYLKTEEKQRHIKYVYSFLMSIYFNINVVSMNSADYMLTDNGNFHQLG